MDLLAEAAGVSQALGEGSEPANTIERSDQASTSRAVMRTAAAVHQAARLRRVHDTNRPLLTGWFADGDEDKVIDILNGQSGDL